MPPTHTTNPPERQQELELLTEIRDLLVLLVKATTKADRKLFTKGDAARRLGVSRSTVERICLNGSVKQVPVGRRYRIPLSEIERLERDGIPGPKRRGRPPKPKQQLESGMSAAMMIAQWRP